MDRFARSAKFSALCGHQGGECFGGVNTPEISEKNYTQKTDLLLVTKFARAVEPTVSRFVVKTVLCLLQAWKCTKIGFGRGLAPDPTGEAYSAPSDP